MTGRELEKRLQLQEDREAIRELMARYCWTIDEGKHEEFVNLFSDEMDFEGVAIESRLGVAGYLKEEPEWIVKFDKDGAIIPDSIIGIPRYSIEGIDEEINYSFENPLDISATVKEFIRPKDSTDVLPLLQFI